MDNIDSSNYKKISANDFKEFIEGKIEVPPRPHRKHMKRYKKANSSDIDKDELQKKGLDHLVGVFGVFLIIEAIHVFESVELDGKYPYPIILLNTKIDKLTIKGVSFEYFRIIDSAIDYITLIKCEFSCFRIAGGNYKDIVIAGGNYTDLRIEKGDFQLFRVLGGEFIHFHIAGGNFQDFRILHNIDKQYASLYAGGRVPEDVFDVFTDNNIESSISMDFLRFMGSWTAKSIRIQGSDEISSDEINKDKPAISYLLFENGSAKDTILTMTNIVLHGMYWSNFINMANMIFTGIRLSSQSCISNSVKAFYKFELQKVTGNAEWKDKSKWKEIKKGVNFFLTTEGNNQKEIDDFCNKNDKEFEKENSNTSAQDCILKFYENKFLRKFGKEIRESLQKSLKDPNSKAKILMYNSDLGKSVFTDCDFEKTKQSEQKVELDFRGSKITEVFLINTRMPKEITITETEKETDKSRHQRLGYAQLKKVYENRGNSIVAAEYLTKEMEAHRAFLTGISIETIERKKNETKSKRLRGVIHNIINALNNRPPLVKALLPAILLLGCVIGLTCQAHSLIPNIARVTLILLSLGILFIVVKVFTLKNEIIDNAKLGERFILWLNKASSNHGESWIQALLFTLCTGLYFFLLYGFSIGLRADFSFYKNNFQGWHIFWNYMGYFSEFINPVHKTDFVDIQGTNLTGTARWIDALGRIFIGYGIYQFIQAFRKYGRKS